MGRGDKENRRGLGEGYCTQTIRKFCRKPGHGGSILPVIGQHLGMKGGLCSSIMPGGLWLS